MFNKEATERYEVLTDDLLDDNISPSTVALEANRAGNALKGGLVQSTDEHGLPKLAPGNNQGTKVAKKGLLQKLHRIDPDKNKRTCQIDSSSCRRTHF